MNLDKPLESFLVSPNRDVRGIVDRLIREASLSTLKHRIGCVILNKKGRIISSGHNQMKTHPIQYRYAVANGEECKVYLHAEIKALIQLSGERPYHLFTMRLGKKGEWLLSRPCCICYSYILDTDIKYISYTDKNKIITERVCK